MRKLYFLFLLFACTAKGQTFIDSFPPEVHFFQPVRAAQGDFVWIFGAHFNTVNNVRFGGVASTQVHVVSDSLIKAQVGAGATGFVSVSTQYGTDSLGGFVYVARDSSRPDITSFNPASARAGAVVDIFGRHFTNTVGVRFGGTPAASFIVLSDSLVRARVGNGASGFVSLSTPLGTDSLKGFTFIRDTFPTDTFPPEVHKFSPEKGTRGTRVLIAGAHFKQTTAVSFGRVPAASFTVVTDSIIVAIVDTGATGAVRVTTRFGTDTLGTFFYKPPIVIGARLMVAPNPADGFAIITHPVTTAAKQLKLTDIAGNVVKVTTANANANQTRLNVADVKPGVYKVGWSDGSLWYTETLLVK